MDGYYSSSEIPCSSPKLPCFAHKNSLFRNRHIPQENPAESGLSRSCSGKIRPDSPKFPVNFPVSRELTSETGSRLTGPTTSLLPPLTPATGGSPKTPH